MKTVTINGKSFELNDAEEKIYDMISIVSKEAMTADQVRQLIIEAIQSIEFPSIDESEGMKELKAAFKAQGMMLKQMQEVGATKAKTVGQQYAEALSTRKDAFERFKKRQDNSFEIELKVAGTILESTNIGAGTYLPVPQFIPGVTPIIANAADIIPLCNVAGCTSPLLVWVEKKNPDGTCVVTAEGVTKPLLDFDFDPNTSTALKYPGKMKVSTEALEDIPFMESEINTELKRAVDLAADTAVMAYIAGRASAFTLTTVLTTKPNNADAIRAAIAQIKSLNHNATVAVLNPIDAANMDLEKSDEGMYVLPPFTTGDGQTIKGIRVVESNQITQGYVLVGDMSKVRVFVYKPFRISMGWVDGDFEDNLVTIIGETRIHYYIEDAYTTALVYDALSDIKTAITEI